MLLGVGAELLWAAHHHWGNAADGEVACCFAAAAGTQAVVWVVVAPWDSSPELYWIEISIWNFLLETKQ